MFACALCGFAGQMGVNHLSSLGSPLLTSSLCFLRFSSIPYQSGQKGHLHVASANMRFFRSERAPRITLCTTQEAKGCFG
jgi:hypothetical protein